MVYLHKCENPLCDRLVKLGVAYCCDSCARAHEKHYEIHESGILGHSEACNQRHAQRGPVHPSPPEVRNPNGPDRQKDGHGE